MKKIIFILLVLIVGCKTTKTTTESNTETKTDLTVKKDSVKTETKKTNTFVIDTSNMVVSIIDEYFAEPDTTGFQPLVRKIITRINSNGKKTIITNEIKKDSIQINSEIKDKTKAKTAFKQKIKESVSTPGFITTGAIIIIIAIVIFAYLIIRKYWL